MIWSLLALPGVLVWLVILLLPWRPWRIRETLEAEAGEMPDLSRVTVLIPARNEAEYVSATLKALEVQGTGFRIILIDDQSDDDTATAATAAGVGCLHVIRGDTVPAGWSGKLWALEQGRRLAETEILLLLDADVRLQPGLLAALVRKLDRERLDMASLMVCLRMSGAWEKLLLPAFVFFFRLLYPFSLVNSAASPVAAAAGGCLLIKRTALDAAGGFAAIRGCLIDDCALAGRVKSHGGRIWIGLTRSAHSQRRYDDFHGVREMVARNAFTQLQHSGPRLVLCTVLMLAAFPLPVIALALPELKAQLAGMLGLALMIACYLPTLRYYGLAPLWAGLLPVAGILFLAMTWMSAWRYLSGVGAAWKGRRYISAGPVHGLKLPIGDRSNGRKGTGRGDATQGIKTGI